MRRPRRGAALILVLGTLVLLASLGTSFAVRTGLDRRISRNYQDAVRARLLAASGVEHALALLETDLRRGLLMERTRWKPREEHTLRVDGKPAVHSGAPSSATYARQGDFYTLEIIDGSSRINVNDGVAEGPDHSVSRNLRRILNILGAQPGVDVPGLGDRLLDARPSAGYRTPFDFLGALDSDREAFGRVRGFLTVGSWSDDQVANPVPLSAEAAPVYPVEYLRPAGPRGPIYRYGHQKNWRGEPIRQPLLFFDPSAPPSTCAVWGRDSLNPQWIEIVSRSPVNVNTAPREVLMALLIDLEGFFLVERRREPEAGSGASACRSPGGAYAWTSLRYTYDGTGNEGDECGFLYRTLPIAGPGGRNSRGIPAASIVDEILACRERRLSQGIPGLDYRRVPFGGPFRSWAQFHLFVDELVRGGILEDDRRSWFQDLDASGRPAAESEEQRAAASQAIGDVLKANFNPNLHLNELNPDRALYLRVDKTDLIVNSTEFCFTPMGTFEIRSTGRVVRPVDGSEDAAKAADNVERASYPLSVHVRLFDARRETAQAHFAAGEFGPRRRGPETSTNRGIECGPEPDNGPAPLENGYEGYLQLPTYGSNLTGKERKPAGELRTTLTDGSFYPGAEPSPPGGRHLGSRIHAHYQFDHAAHYHAGRTRYRTPPDWDGFRLPQGAWQTAYALRCCISRNWADRTESLASPYGPVDSGRADESSGDPQRFRLARSFRALPRPFEAAPGDLRVDGAYVERHSAFGYWIDESVSFNFNEGAVAFWMKPAFFPRMTGKRRTLLSLGRYHAARPDFMNPSPFGLFFVPPHRGENGGVPSYARGLDSFPPLSLAFGFGFSTATGYNWELKKGGVPEGGPPEKHATSHAFVFSPPLDAHLKHHEWVHLAVTWSNPRDTLPGPGTVRLYVNGKILPGTREMAHLYGRGPQKGQPFLKTPRWTTHSLRALLPGRDRPRWCKNSIRVGGEPSKLFDLPGDAWLFPGNYSADATFDEFYVWLDRFPGYLGGLWGAQTLWNRGRYYRPDDDDPDDARFVSPPIDVGLPGARGRKLRRRILGVSWTAWAEGYDRRGADRMSPWMLDHRSSPPREARLDTAAEVQVEVDGVWYGPFRNDHFSPVQGASGAPPAAENPGNVRYAVKLKAGTTRRSGGILLASPILDDVTLFVDSGRPRILSWVEG